MSDRIRKACYGAFSGHTLGAPFKGRPGFTRVTFYEPIPKRMSACPALDAWIVMADPAKPLSAPTEVQDRLFDHWGYREGAAGFGAANAALGLGTPISGAFANPLANSGDAIGRCLFWGLVFPDQPVEAARWASFDAAYDRSGDAVRAGAALAAAVATARLGTDFAAIVSVIRAGLPQDSAVNKVVKTVLQWIGQADAVRSTVTRVQQELALSDSQDALMVFTTVLAAIANSKDAPGAVCSAVGCGGASDQTGLATGVLASLLWEGMPSEWTSVLGDAYVAGHGLRSLDPPKGLGGFVELVEAAKVRLSGPDVGEEPESATALPGEAAAIETTSEEPDLALQAPGPDIPVEAPAVELTVLESTSPPSLPALPGLPSLPFTSAWDVEGLRVEWQYLDSPVVQEGQRWQAAVRFVNTTPEVMDVEAKVSGPSDWAIATRLSSFRLEAGASAIHGVIARPIEVKKLKPLKLSVNGKNLKVAVLSPQSWYVAGPFGNDDGTAFTKEFPQERAQTQKDHFSGRSGSMVKWAELSVSGRVFDVEPLFQDGPGVVFLFARFELPKPGPHRIVAAGSPGVVVRVDGNLIVRYQDTHVPVARDQPPYSAAFIAGDETVIVVKLIRDRKPAEPLTLYFLDDQGRVADPSGFRPLPE